MKYIIKVDKEIANCYQCPCSNLERDICKLKNKDLKYIEGYVVLPEWCPLKKFGNEVIK